MSRFTQIIKLVNCKLLSSANITSLNAPHIYFRELYLHVKIRIMNFGDYCRKEVCSDQVQIKRTTVHISVTLCNECHTTIPCS